MILQLKEKWLLLFLYIYQFDRLFSVAAQKRSL